MIISRIKKECQNVVIGLDHNMDFLKSSKHESTQDFINQNLEWGMLPMVTRPTRITKTSATIDRQHYCEYELCGKIHL